MSFFHFIKGMAFSFFMCVHILLFFCSFLGQVMFVLHVHTPLIHGAMKLLSKATEGIWQNLWESLLHHSLTILVGTKRELMFLTWSNWQWWFISKMHFIIFIIFDNKPSLACHNYHSTRKDFFDNCLGVLSRLDLKICKGYSVHNFLSAILLIKYFTVF